MATPDNDNHEEYQPREFIVPVGNTTLLVRCDYRLENMAEWLISTLLRIHEQSPLTPGFTLDIGWSDLVLLPEGDGLVVCEPNFADKPLEQAVADVTVSLNILAEQNAIIFETQTEQTALVPRFNAICIVEKGALEKDQIYLERNEPQYEDDSGWLIGDSENAEAADDDTDDEISDENFIVMPLYQLLHERPGIIPALALPPGFMVILHGNDIVEIYDDRDDEVWNTETTNGKAH